MIAVQPGLAAVSLIPVPIVVGIAARYGRRSRPALQELQQRIAELTADVEENIGGVRVVKSFAREDRQLERFRGGVGRIWDQAMVTTRLQAFYNPFIGFLPQLGLAAILFFGGRQVIDGRLTIGEFSAFYAYLLMLLSPMRTLGHLAGAGPAGDGGRRPRLPDPRPRAAHRLGARSAGAAARLGPRRAARGHAAIRERVAPGAARRRPRRAGGDDGRGGRRHGLGQDDAGPAHPAALRRHRRCRARRRRRRARGRRLLAALRDRRGQRRPVPLQRDGGREHRLRARRTRRRRRSSSPRGARRPTSSSSACRTATRRGWASAG